MAGPELYVADNNEVKVSGHYVYCITEEGGHITGPCKIGVAYDPAKRLGGLQTGNWRPLHIVWAVKVWGRDYALSLESLCLTKHRPCIYGYSTKKRLKSEWVDATPDDVLEHLLACMKRAGVPVEKAAA